MGLVIILSCSICLVFVGINLKKHVFANRVFTVIPGQKEFLRDERILIVMQYLLPHKAQVFSYDILKVTKQLLDLFRDNVEIVNQTRHITLTHHVCIKETLMEDLSTNVSFGDFCFSRYDVTLCVFSRHLLFTLCGCKNFQHLLLILCCKNCNR